MIRTTLNRAGVLAGLTCAASLLAVSTAFAQDGQRPGGDPNERQALLERFDADGDGRLNDDERNALREHMRSQGDRGERGERGDRGEGRGRGGERGGFGGPGGGGGPMGMVARGMFRPLFMTRDLPVFIEMLDLDEGQSQIVEAVLEDYDAAFRMAAEEARDAVGDMNEEMRNNPESQERFEELRGEMESMREEMRAARQSASEGEGETQMSEEQRNAMREEFRARMDAMRGGFREAMQEHMDSESVQDNLSQQRAVYRQFDAVRRGMNAETEEAIAAILAEDQAAKWEDVMRRIRRERLLPEGRVSGESFDVEKSVRPLADQLDDTTAANVHVLVNNWAVDVDDALQRRDAFDTPARFDAMEAMSSRDYEALEKISLDRLRLQRTVRDVNDEAVIAIAAVLPEELGAQWQADAQREGYGRWLRQARSLRAIDEALQLEDLEDNLREAILELQIDCVAAMAEQDARVLAAARQHEEPRELDFIRRMASGDMGRGEREDTPLDMANDTRREVDEEFIEALKDLLGEDRIAEVSSLQERGRRTRGGEGRGGADREEMRRQFMERFDTNGDGEIDEQEREAIRETFQGRGGRGGGEARGGRGGQGRGGQGGGQGRGGQGGSGQGPRGG